VGPAYRLLTDARQKLHTKRTEASVLWSMTWSPPSCELVHCMSHLSRTANIKFAGLVWFALLAPSAHKWRTFFLCMSAK